MSEEKKQRNLINDTGWMQEAPIGDAFYKKLIQYCVSLGGKVESHALELKGAGLNPNSKGGGAKIAKFILASANRDTQTAAQYFSGYAIMVIGIEKNGVINELPVCEDMDINRYIEDYLGENPPIWKTQWIHSNGQIETGVLFVIVNPPKQGDRIYVCCKDGAELEDGAIYVRTKGETRKAKSIDLELLQRRASVKYDPDFALQVHLDLYQVNDYEACKEVLLNFVHGYADHLRGLYKEPKPRSLLSIPNDDFYFGPRRSKSEYFGEINTWESEKVNHINDLSRDIMALCLPPFEISLHNISELFVSDLRIEVQIPASDTLLIISREDNIDFDDAISSAEDIFSFPSAWKENSFLGVNPMSHFLPSNNAAQKAEYTFEYIEQNRAGRLYCQSVRPRSEEKYQFPDYVFLSIDSSELPKSFPWSATLLGKNAVFSGYAEVNVKEIFLIEIVKKIIAGVLDKT